MSIDEEKLKEGILDILKKHSYTSKFNQCPMTTLKFLLKIENTCLDDSTIYNALCELEEEDKAVKSFEQITSNLSMKISSSRWYLNQKEVQRQRE